jgi:hypothetical protein
MLDFALDESLKLLAKIDGATSSLRYDSWDEYPVRKLNRSVASAPISGSQVNIPISSYAVAVTSL